jgi:hypothetical protein
MFSVPTANTTNKRRHAVTLFHTAELQNPWQVLPRL